MFIVMPFPFINFYLFLYNRDYKQNSGIKTHGSELQGQGGSSKRYSNKHETHMCEYFTGTIVVKIKNTMTKEP